MASLHIDTDAMDSYDDVTGYEVASMANQEILFLFGRAFAFRRIGQEEWGIHKVAFEKNVSGNAFWEKVGFTVRDDLVYRNKNIHQLKSIDLI